MNTILNRLTQENWESINGAFGPYVATAGTDATRSTVMNNRHTIAKLHYSFGPHDQPAEVQDQNSRACAAVPVMLRALECSVNAAYVFSNAVGEERREQAAGSIGYAAAMARSALALATGSEDTQGAVSIDDQNDAIRAQVDREIHGSPSEAEAPGTYTAMGAENRKLRRQVAELTRERAALAQTVLDLSAELKSMTSTVMDQASKGM